jgi:catechol 2,3-dioxygenase-like lactoylglutathione lyase family enzyme
MKRKIIHIALIVHDYDEAILFYTEKLDFVLIEDSALSPEKRWVLLKPNKNSECSILLAKASDKEQRAIVGNQTGGRVFLFLETDNFQRDYNKMLEKGINFIRKPSQQEYGTVAVFEDLYGNLWDLIEYIE